MPIELVQLIRGPVRRLDVLGLQVVRLATNQTGLSLLSLSSLRLPGGTAISRGLVNWATWKLRIRRPSTTTCPVSMLSEFFGQPDPCADPCGLSIQ